MIGFKNMLARSIVVLMSFLLLTISLSTAAQTVGKIRLDEEEAPMARPPPPDPTDDPPYNQAIYINQSVPTTTMVTNSVHNVWVTMQNYGTSTWYPGTHALGSQGPQDNSTWGIGRVQLPAGVPPGEKITFNFQVRAPSTAGTYTFQWRMLEEYKEWFGSYTNALNITVRDPINDAQLVSQSIPDQMRTGQRQEIEVTMRNNGESPWTRAQQYTLMAQNPHNNTAWGLNRVPLPVETVNPGESATFRFTVTAPSTANWYMSQWGMQREGYGSFGTSSNGIWVNVTEPANNAQPTGQDVTTQMETNKPYTASVTMVNNGESTWTREKQYTLMSQSPPNNTTWGNNRVPLPVDNIAPGQSVTFNFPVTAPGTAGDHVFQWSMQREGYGSFGASTTPVTVKVTAPVNNAQVVGTAVPTRMQNGIGYDVSVTMKNTGTTTWTPGAYKLGHRDWANEWLWGVQSVALPVSVAPGQQFTFQFKVWGPAPGNYALQWAMVYVTGNEWFGGVTNSPVTVTENFSNVTFIHTDGLGSPVARTDGDGKLVSRTRYEPYGLVAGGATPTIGFTGHVNDADTGLTYMQQRYYDPVAGRFLSVDPMTTNMNTGQAFARYAYALNNPYRFIDPDGREEKPIDKEAERQKKRLADENNKRCGTGQCNGLSNVRANSLASEISARGGISGKNEADMLYLFNSDPNLTVTVEASQLSVTALGEWKLDPNGGLKAPGYVNGLDYWVHGQVTIRARPDGTYGIYNQRYHYDMHFDFSPRGVARNIATFLGEPPSFWPFFKGTPYTIQYRGNVNLVK